MYFCTQGIIRNKAKLETVDSTKAIAATQGELEGMKELVICMVDIFNKEMPSFEMEISYAPEDLAGPLIDWPNIDDYDINVIYQALLFDEEMEVWKKIDEVVDRRLEQKKTYLFYLADKSQDLFKVHGFREGITTHRTLFEAIRNEKRQREDKNPLFASYE